MKFDTTYGKALLASKTFWAALVSAAIAIALLFRVQLSADKLMAAGAAVAAFFAIIFRATATEQISGVVSAGTADPNEPTTPKFMGEKPPGSLSSYLVFGMGLSFAALLAGGCHTANPPELINLRESMHQATATIRKEHLEQSRALANNQQPPTLTAADLRIRELAHTKYNQLVDSSRAKDGKSKSAVAATPAPTPTATPTPPPAVPPPDPTPPQ